MSTNGIRFFGAALAFLSLLCPLVLPGQLIPPIRNFQPALYRAENQNWDITQAPNGWMYFANNSGLLEFNGETWNRYPSPNGSMLRSVLALEDRIYSGCYMDFGYWERDATGGMQYHSLSATLPASLLEDEQFWNIRSLDTWVLFQSLQRIYAYNTEEGDVEIIPSEASRAQLFADQDRLYFLQEGRLMTLENGEVGILARLEPGQRAIVGLARLDGQRVFITEEGQFLSVEADRLVPYTPSGGVALPPVKVYSSLQLRDGKVALGTISQGLFILSEAGRLWLHLNKESGLNNNTVLALGEDRDGDLWMGLDNGISVLNRSSSFREFNDATGRLGEVYAAALYQGILYIGTNQGLFKSAYPITGAFSFVPGTEGQVWNLKAIHGSLFCGHDRGTFLVEGGTARRVSGLPGTWDFKPVPGRDSLVLQGHYQGLSLLERSGGEWTLRNTLQGYDISSRFFEFSQTGNLIVNHEYKGIYTLELDSGLTRISVADRHPPLGIGASLFRYGGALYYATDNEVYGYEEASGEFVPDSLLTAGLKSGADRPYGVLIPDPAAGRLWGFGNGAIHYVDAGAIDKRPKFNKVHVPGDFRTNMGVLGFECLAPITRHQYLIGRSNGFVVLDLEQTHEVVPVPSLTRVLQVPYNQPSRELPLEGAMDLDPGENHLAFEFSVPEFGKFREVKYQYRLEGLQDDWTPWSVSSSATFNNLPHGRYRFEVRARIGEAVSGEAAGYDFEILPPWYLSRGAFAGYLLLLLALLFGVHRAYRAYYRRQHRRMTERDRAEAKRNSLRAKKKLMEARNAQLQQEIDSKNRELAISTLSLIKKNEFLNALKSQLKSARDPSDIRSVIRTIDRNIGSEDDWKFFEEAFNNADKGFLQKLREKHTDLTPSDLRLCAYLRLNLSSKEIAPLLNISVRSVEVKRYRLRKKLGLSHEDNLSDYILAFQK